MQAKPIFKLSVLVMSLSLAGCPLNPDDKKSSGGGLKSNSAYQLSDKDFSVQATEVSSAFDLIEKINDTDEFYNQEPDEPLDSITQCIDAKIKQTNSVYERAADETFYSAFEIQGITECVDTFDFDSVNIVNDRASVYYSDIVVENSQGEPLDLAGKELGEITQEGYTLTQRNYRFKIQFELEATDRSGKKQRLKVNTIISKSSSATVDRPCAYKNGFVDCVYSRILTTDTPNLSTGGRNIAISRLHLKPKSLPVKEPGRYFPSGNIDFEFNDWKGVMVYSAADSAPVYTAENKQGQGISATFGEANYTTQAEGPDLESLVKLNQQKIISFLSKL